MAYTIYPAVDENYNFPPQIADKLYQIRGSIYAGDTLNKYFGKDYQGLWQFSLSSGQEITGLPPNTRAGVVLVLPQLGGQIVSSYGDTSGPEQLWYRGRNALSGDNPHGGWQDLRDANSIKNTGTILPTDNLDFWYIPEKAGFWKCNSTTSAQSVKNLPIPAPGNLINIPGGINLQIYISHAITGYPAGFFFRTRLSTGSASWSDWINLAGANSGGSDGTQYGLKHMYRNDTARKRLGYKIGAPCAVALQFDDYNALFRDKVLPILREFDVPATMALAVNWVEGTVNHPLAAAVPWTDVQSWVINDGLEAQGHSWTHSAASSQSQVHKEIVESADYMESKMTSVEIDAWSMPGTGEDPPYGGYTGRTIEDFTETYAGKLLLSRYGFVGAARGGYLQPGGGVDYIGQSHGIGEASTVEEAKAAVEVAIENGYAVAMMHHPGWLDTEGYKTTAQLREFIQWLAQQRDAGRLILTTRRALNVFDNTTNDRNNLLPGVFNGKANGWTGTNWKLNAAGNWSYDGTNYATSKSVTLLPVAWARGGTREYHAMVRANQAMTVTMKITCGTTLAKTKTFNIPANEWVDIRTFFTIPKIGGTTLQFDLIKTSGILEVHQVNCYAA